MKQFDKMVKNYLGSLNENEENLNILSQLLDKSTQQDSESLASVLADLISNDGDKTKLDLNTQQTLTKFGQKFKELSSTLSSNVSSTPTTTSEPEKKVTVSPQTQSSTIINPQYPS